MPLSRGHLSQSLAWPGGGSPLRRPSRDELPHAAWLGSEVAPGYFLEDIWLSTRQTRHCPTQSTALGLKILELLDLLKSHTAVDILRQRLHVASLIF